MQMNHATVPQYCCIYLCTGWMPFLKYFTFFSIRWHFRCQTDLTIAINTDWSLKRAQSCSCQIPNCPAKRQPPHRILQSLPTAAVSSILGSRLKLTASTNPGRATCNVINSTKKYLQKISLSADTGTREQRDKK